MQVFKSGCKGTVDGCQSYYKGFKDVLSHGSAAKNKR